MNQYTKDRLKVKLKEYLNREPSADECINAEGDYGLLIPILLEEVELLKKNAK